MAEKTPDIVTDLLGCNFSAVAREVLGSMGPTSLHTEVAMEGIARAMFPDQGWVVRDPRRRYSDSVTMTEPQRDRPAALLIPATALRLRLGSMPTSPLALFYDWGWSPIMVIEGVLDMHSGKASWAAALVLLRAEEREPATPTRFFQPPVELSDQTEILSDVKRLLSVPGGRTKFGFIFRGDLDQDSWASATHDPKTKDRLKDLKSLGETVLLAEVFQVLTAKHVWHDHHTKAEPATGTVVNGIDVARGVLNPADKDVAALTASARRGQTPRAEQPRRSDLQTVELRSGDLLMVAVEGPRLHSPLVVTDQDLPLRAGSKVLVLRPLHPLSPSQVDLYVAYLRSNRSRQALRALVPGGWMLNLNAGIRKLQIPRADSPLEEAISSISSASREFRSWSTQADDLLGSIFDDGHTVAQMRLQLLEQGRTTRQQLVAGQQVPTLEYRVRELYPHPIAYRWRQLSTLREAKDWAAVHGAVLATYETLLAFCGLASWAAAMHSDRALPATYRIVLKFRDGNGGVSLGDWVNILKQVSGNRNFRSSDPDSLLGVMARFLPETGEATEAQVRLTARRNDGAHGREADPVHIQREAHQAITDLERLLTNAAFLVDLQLVHVLDNRWNSLKGTGLAKVHVLQGDHPLSRVDHRPHQIANLEKDSLYVIDPQGTWLLLRPLLVRHMCPQCGSQSIYHPDQCQAGQFTLKALDHGHTTHDPEVDEALRSYLQWPDECHDSHR